LKHIVLILTLRTPAQLLDAHTSSSLDVPTLPSGHTSIGNTMTGRTSWQFNNPQSFSLKTSRGTQ